MTPRIEHLAEGVTLYFRRRDMVRGAKIGRHVKWSLQETQKLRSSYPHLEWGALLRLFPGRTRVAINIKAAVLGVRRELNRKMPWTGREKHLLRKLYPTAPWEIICKELPRHPRGSVEQMARVMRLSRDCAKASSSFALIRQLRTERRSRGIPTWALAETIGIHAVQLAKWERGEQLPRLRGLFDWVEALGLVLTLIDRPTPAKQEVLGI